MPAYRSRTTTHGRNIASAYARRRSGLSVMAGGGTCRRSLL